MREDGTTVLAYNQDTVDKMDPDNMFDSHQRQYERNRNAWLGTGTYGKSKRTL